MKQYIMVLFLFIFVTASLIVHTRDPFSFPREDTNTTQPHEPELQGFSQNENEELALISCDHELFTVGLGESFSHWKVKKMEGNKVIIVDKDTEQEKELNFI